MEDKVKINLGEVQKTLLIPLFGRAVDYESPKSVLKDRYAFEIVKKLDYEFKGALAKAPAQHVINCAVRAYHLDTALRQVIARNPDATVINIGAASIRRSIEWITGRYTGTISISPTRSS